MEEIVTQSKKAERVARSTASACSLAEISLGEEERTRTGIPAKKSRVTFGMAPSLDRACVPAQGA